jgi:2,3-dihydro-2,3-dihydroxybenzoate dehydrogenase
MVDRSLSGRVAIVTGARRGIGKAIATSLARAGGQVALADIDADEVSAAAAEVAAMAETGTLGVRVDVTDAQQVRTLVSDTVERFGRLDVLVNAAGILHVAPFLEQTEAEWDESLRVNAKGTFLCGQAAAARMVAQTEGGRIINVASNAARVPRMHNAAYCASKAAVLHLTRVMALELAAHDITVNALCPGATATEMLLNVQAGGVPSRLDGIVKGSLELHRTGIPLGRLAEPQEQAAAVAFLASDDARFITGQAITVDGGQTTI